MAISKGTETKETSEKVLFTGIAPLKVLAVNPTKKELETIYGRDIDKEPEYLSVSETGVKKIRLDFIVQTVAGKLGCDIESISKVSYFLENRPRYNKDESKAEVVNLYGESTWIPVDDIKAKKVPDNMQFFDSAGMRAACVGEVELVGFLKAFLGIPNKGFNGVNIADISMAEIQLEEIKRYFDGNIKEISSAIKLRKDTNIVKMLAGVKTTDDNKQYQAWFTQKPLKFGVSDYKYLAKALDERLQNGAYSTTSFGPADFKFRLFKNEPTDIKKDDSEDPFASTAASSSSDDDFWNN
jgi:hypothetical protein